MSYSFGLTPEFDCPYIDAETSKNLVLWPGSKVDRQTASELNSNGFRRSGKMIYRPHCQACQRCESTRISAPQLHMPRRFKRILKATHNFEVVFDREFDANAMYELYQSYICTRHRDSDMFPPNQNDFLEFLGPVYSFVKYLKIFDGKTLVGVMVVDELSDGLSAVYSFFSPSYERYSIGTLMILKLIEFCRTSNLSFCYIGYIVDGCAKMTYKSAFTPQERFIDLKWV